jgi:hypothetical protein
VAHRRREIRAQFSQPKKPTAGKPRRALICPAPRQDHIKPELFMRFMTAAIALTLTVPLSSSFAQSLSRLQPGLYLPERAPCSAIGGAGTVSFDGRNLSGHYQLCVTRPLSGDTYKSTCVEAQGPDLTSLTEEKVLIDPDRTEIRQQVKLTSPKSFELNSVKYRFCGDL